LGLTKKQLETLQIIAEYWRMNGYGPSIADIRDKLGLSKNSGRVVLFRIKSLEKSFFISRGKGVARSIKLTAKGRGQLNVIDHTGSIDASSTNISQNSPMIFSKNINIYKAKEDSEKNLQ